MASLSFLGTGPGSGLPGRFQSSILLQTDSSHILLDAGDPCLTQLLNRGFALPDLDAVWITHAHSDHVGGLSMLIQASWIARRARPLPIIVPRHFVEPLKDWLRAVFLPPEIVGFPVEISPWDPGSSLSFNDLSVKVLPTSHLDSIRTRMNDSSLESFLFDIDVSGRRLVYSGDIGSMADLAPVLADPIDLLVCELAHVTPEDAVAALASAQVDTLCFTHLSPANDARRAQIQLLCADSLPQIDAIYFPGDGERIDF